MDIDDITSKCMIGLTKLHLQAYACINHMMAIGNGILKSQLLHSNIKWLICVDRRGSIESNMPRQHNITTVVEITQR
jgi:hypothetical protein